MLRSFKKSIKKPSESEIEKQNSTNCENLEFNNICREDYYYRSNYCDQIIFSVADKEITFSAEGLYVNGQLIEDKDIYNEIKRFLSISNFVN